MTSRALAFRGDRASCGYVARPAGSAEGCRSRPACLLIGYLAAGRLTSTAAGSRAQDKCGVVGWAIAWARSRCWSAPSGWRTSWSSRCWNAAARSAAPGTRVDPGPDPDPVPVRGHPARAARRRGRGRRRDRGHRHLRARQGLGHRDPGGGLGRRAGCRRPHRRARRLFPHLGRAHVTNRGALGPLTSAGQSLAGVNLPRACRDLRGDGYQRAGRT